MICLGIDTSNYTTSVALYRGGEVIQKKKLLPVKPGSVGLRQSDAVFHHTQQLFELYGELAAEYDMRDVNAVGVSSRPRPVDGSYMPCFSVGFNAASIVASTLSVPLYTFSHQEGHIAAAIFSAGSERLFSERFIAFHVSGGTTEAVLAEPNGSGFSLELIAKTLDLNAGQAVDRVGVMLGLDFPCGRELERLALRCDEPLKVRPTLKGADCCLSGVENQCRKLYNNNSSKEYISAYCLKFIEQTICRMTDELIKKYGSLPLLYAGGVMSNSIIRRTVQDRFGACFAEPEFSADNAAGIAYLTARKAKND